MGEWHLMTTNHTLAERGERGEVEITEADREAAASYGQRTDWDKGYILSGKADDLPTVQSFAKHRIAARNAAMEECAKIAESDRLVLGDTRRPGSFAGTRKDHGELIASVIRAEASQLSTQPHTNGET